MAGFGRFLKWMGIMVAGLAGLAIIAGIALYFLFDWNWLKGDAIERLSDATGRKIEINGNITGEFSLTPRIAASGVRIANAEWGQEPYLADIKAIEFRIRLWDLLTGRINLTELTIDQADIRLEKNKDGDANWKLGPSVAGTVTEAVPEERGEFPIISQLVIDNSRLVYRDPGRNIDIASQISLAKGEGGSGEQEVQLLGKGRFEGKPAKVQFHGASLLKLRETDVPYPVKLSLDVGGTHIAVDGTITDPLNPENFDIKMDLKGESLADLYLIFRTPLPPTDDYALSGHLSRKGNQWEFTDMKGQVGDSDLSGDVKVDVAGKRPMMVARLVSTNLDFKDLGGLIGAPPDREVKTKVQPAAQQVPDDPLTSATTQKIQNQRLLPDVPIDPERLHAMDMRVDFEGKKIKTPELPIDDLKMRLNLDDGVLRLDPLAFGLAGGSLKGTLVLNSRQPIPAVDADLTLSNINLKQFVQRSDMADVTEGKLGGKIKLAGQGKSFADVMGTSSGRLTLAMTGGHLDPLIVELIGLDVGQALLVLADPPKPVTIRCALADLTVQNGLATINGFVIDTTDSNIWATGTVNFKDESLDVVINADPKDVSLLSANAPVAISGSFARFTIAVDPTHTSDKGGLAEALGSIVNPIIALLPFVDLGLGQDTDCRHFEPSSGKPVPANNPGSQPSAPTNP